MNQPDKEVEITYQLPDSPLELLESIIDHYPEGDFQSLRKVIGIGKVRYEEELLPGVPMTAAVVNTKPYTLLFGKTFLSTKMKTIEDCVYILSHELTHLVLDHFAKDIMKEFEEKKLGAQAVHIIVDCQVNATCYNSLKEDKYLEFIKRFYSKTEMPYCFFRPDGEPPSDKLKEVHAKLYSQDGITNKELIDGLMEWFKSEQDKLEDIVKKLLGNHKDLLRDKTGDNNSEELDDLIEAVGSDLEDVLKKNKEEEAKDGANREGKPSNEKAEQPGKGCSPDITPREKMVKHSLEKIEYVKNIKRQLKKVEVISPSSRIYKAIDAYFPKKQARTVIPNFYDRRTATMYSQGIMPIFHQTSERGSKIIVPCYLDVSGSQDHVIPFMLPVVSRLKQKIGNVVYCFSGFVSETPMCKLELGKIKTSGGTDFNPVIEHILKHKFKNAIILTDGEAYLRDDLLLKVKNKRVNITVGWTVANPQTSPLGSIACKTFYVFGESGGQSN
jgi:hypothetical protein